MRLLLNGEQVVLPSSLSEITLGQRIAFQKEHGDLLNTMLKEIQLIEDEDLREIEFTLFQFEQCFRTVAFFLNTTVEAIKESSYIDQIWHLYQSSLSQIFEDELKQEEDLEMEFAWNNELWELHEPDLKQGSRMTFGEFIDSKQIIQDMLGLGKDKLECLLPLCAVFLRRKDEPYEESFLYEGSERLKLMESLPLNIALQVGFFLSSSLKGFKSHFQSSFQPEPNLVESI